MADSTAERAFTHHHTWALADTSNGTAIIGITDFLAERLGRIGSLDLPMKDDEIDMETQCIHLHTGHKIHHLRSPLSGRVIEINEDVQDNPNLLHIDPYENWLYKMEFDDADELELLMSESRYQRFVDKL